MVNYYAMKAAKIILWVVLSVFAVCEFGLCNISDADEGNHCVTCCSLGCCDAIPSSGSFIIDLTANSKIVFAEISFLQDPFLKGLERPPQTIS